METAIERDPALALGSAKQFVESICKGILTARKLTPTGSETLPQLVKAVRQALDLSISAKTSDTLKQTYAAWLRSPKESPNSGANLEAAMVIIRELKSPRLISRG